MNKIISLLYLVIFILIYSNQCIANVKDIDKIQDLIDAIEEESQELVGGAIAIILNEKLIYKKSFGHKEINGMPVNDDTLFSLASVSKPIIATALGVLAEKEITSFEDNIFINDTNLSLKNILSHTTGYMIRGDNEIEKGIARKDLLLFLRKEQPNGVNPNKSYFYSNLIYSLAQEYAETKGYKIDMLIKMLNASLYTLPLKSQNLAYPHSEKKEKLSFPSNYQKIVPASGGIFASLNGMIEFLKIMLGNRPNIISQSTLNKLFESVIEAHDVLNWKILPFKDEEIQSFYCLGWRKLTVKKAKQSTLVFHSGFINGATAFVGIIPEYKAAIVILANQTSRFPLKNGLKLWKNIIILD